MELLDTLKHGRESYRRRAWAAAYQSLARADQATPMEVEDLERLLHVSSRAAATAYAYEHQLL
jgi:hypothetical protein